MNVNSKDATGIRPWTGMEWFRIEQAARTARLKRSLRKDPKSPFHLSMTFMREEREATYLLRDAANASIRSVEKGLTP